MCGTLADAVGERLESLADSYNEGEWDRWAVNPLSVEILGLQTSVRRYLDLKISESAYLF